MHKSRLGGFIIDCQMESAVRLPAAAQFWGAALGMKTKQFSGVEGETYVGLIDRNAALHIEVQSVSHPSRVHLDIETDDIEAEVVRLEALGARRVQHVKGWWVMEAPTGHRFCVVSADGSPDFSANATNWP
jgi:hypothetical protein